MDNLKHQMRQMFEEKYLPHYYSRCNGLEEGILAKILNLSLLNPLVFSAHPWKVLAVTSPVVKQQIYLLSGRNQKLLDSAVVLIIMIDHSIKAEIENITSSMSLSMMYAAKYYGIDFYSVDGPLDFNELHFQLNIPKNYEVILVACLGYFEEYLEASLRQKRPDYCDVVTEI